MVGIFWLYTFLILSVYKDDTIKTHNLKNKKAYVIN